MPGVIATIPKLQFSSLTGAPLAGGTLDIYLAGTTTRTTTWQDSALTAANTNPVVLDSRGACVIWLNSTAAYKLVLKNSAGVSQWTQDNIIGGGVSTAIELSGVAIEAARTESAANAAATLATQTAINNKYRGALASDPATRTDGTPNQAGDEYFHNGSLPNLLKRWNGATWQASDINTANLAAAAGSLLLGRPVGTVGSKLDETPSLRDTGGVADYVGTALYDGADAGRVTATDNTAAFNLLINTAISSGRTAVKIPAGHWAIKTGNLSFSGFDKLHIYGDGIGVTILDFIKEDTTRVAYVDNANAPHVIASFATGNSIEFADMTIKATTKTGVVNGTTGPANAEAVYYGAVWGIKINNVADIRLTRVRVERFNYRGFSVYGANTKRVTMLHCEGFYNVGSGFWIQNAETFRVVGGEYAYNGILGNIGTGYGVTGSLGITSMIVDHPYAHHNYRKGIDTHGAHNFKVKGGTFEDNVIAHVAAPNSAPKTGLVNGVLSVTGCSMSNGATAESESWLRACYQAAYANGFKTTGHAACLLIDSTFAASEVIFADNRIHAAYCGFDVMDSSAENLVQLATAKGRAVYKNNTVNLLKYGATVTQGGYARTPVALNSKNVVIDSNYMRFLATAAFTNDLAEADMGGAYVLGYTDSATYPEYGAVDVQFTRNTTNLNDAKLFTLVGGMRTYPPVFAGSYKFTMHDNITHVMTRRVLAGDGGLWTRVDTLDQSKVSMRNNTVIVNGASFVWDFPVGRRNRAEAIAPLSGWSRNIGDTVARIVVDINSWLASIDLLIKPGDAKPVPINVYLGRPASYQPDHVVTGTDTRFTINTSSTFVDSDGITKVAINVVAAVAMTLLSIDAALSSPRSSYGIERIDIL